MNTAILRSTQQIFPWCFTPELYAARPEYIDSLAEFVRSRPMPPVDAFIRQSGAVLARADEYALAGAALALLSGTPPFPRDDGMAVLYAHLSADPPRLTSRRPELPPAADDVLLRALAKAPEDRYASCGEFADALRIALGLQRYDSDVAVALHEHSLTDQQHRQGRDHTDALVTHGSLAGADAEAATPEEAIAVHAQALAEQQRTVGPDHPDTLATRFSIAQEMAARGDHAAAEKEFREVLAIRQRAPATDGLRNVTGRVNPNGTVTVWALPSTVSGSGDQGAGPNRLVEITDPLSATAPAAGEAFRTVRAARFAEVLRGVSLTPGTRGQ